MNYLKFMSNGPPSRRTWTILNRNYGTCSALGDPCCWANLMSVYRLCSPLAGATSTADIAKQKVLNQQLDEIWTNKSNQIVIDHVYHSKVCLDPAVFGFRIEYSWFISLRFYDAGPPVARATTVPIRGLPSVADCLRYIPIDAGSAIGVLRWTLA